MLTHLIEEAEAKKGNHGQDGDDAHLAGVLGQRSVGAPEAHC